MEQQKKGIRALHAPNQEQALLKLGDYDIVFYPEKRITVLFSRIGMGIFHDYNATIKLVPKREHAGYELYLIHDPASEVAAWVYADALVTFNTVLVTSDQEAVELLQEDVDIAILVTEQTGVEHCILFYKDPKVGQWISAHWTPYKVKGALGKIVQIEYENLIKVLKDIGTVNWVS